VFDSGFLTDNESIQILEEINCNKIVSFLRSLRGSAKLLLESSVRSFDDDSGKLIESRSERKAAGDSADEYMRSILSLKSDLRLEFEKIWSSIISSSRPTMNEIKYNEMTSLMNELSQNMRRNELTIERNSISLQP
jgi:hypothetical protein